MWLMPAFAVLYATERAKGIKALDGTDNQNLPTPAALYHVACSDLTAMKHAPHADINRSRYISNRNFQKRLANAHRCIIHKDVYFPKLIDPLLHHCLDSVSICNVSTNSDGIAPKPSNDFSHLFRFIRMGTIIMTISAPHVAISIAHPRPIPREEPVIKATLPCKSTIFCPFSKKVRNQKIGKSQTDFLPLLSITFYISRLQFPLITEDYLQLVVRLEIVGRVIVFAHVSE